MESSPDFQMTLDKDGLIMDVNRACEALFSKNREGLIGTSIYEYLPEATMEKAIYLIFEKGKVRNIELKVNIQEKGTIICNLSGTVFTTPEGESGIYVTGRDITELKQAEEKLLRSERLAAIGELSASVAHELRQPLSVVNNAAYYLKLTLTEVDETTRDYFDMINEEVKSANDIISSLVALARAEEPDRQEVEVAALIEKAQGKITIPTNIRLRKDIPDDISAVFVDPVHIEQVFYNIINNGIQAMSMPEGGELAIIVRSKEKEANVAVSFVDTGVGISKENQDKIFEPLFTTKTRGIGLGLSICKNFVEANEGDITVQSEEGKGTTMTVVLPVTGLAG
jgi:PAS domain S-box-containing protein